MRKNILVMLSASLLAVCVGVFIETTDEYVASNSGAYVQYDELDNKGIGWGIKKVKGAEPEMPQQQKDILLEYDSFYMNNQKPKRLYLTFDEGYENGYTAKILDVLKEKNVPAAFFVTGPYAKKETGLIQRMIDEGHIVGNHTVNHPNLPKMAVSENIIEELTELNKIVKELYSYDMKYMRPPEGEFSQKVLAISRDLGFRTVFWSFAYPDWNVNNQKGSHYAFSEITPYLHDGAVLLLHAVSKDNTEALGDVIDYARAQGYEFGTLDEID
ncbi:MAG: polysaccharide deacetylase family protein [Clostridia bacterium]|nr:polysaccharide deacetylase family protein [Clostridia bacterium]